MASTPGPWGFRPEPSAKKPWPYLVETVSTPRYPSRAGGMIAQCWRHLSAGETVEDNARLMAASPELLAACKLALKALLEPRDLGAADQLEKAIDKAENSIAADPTEFVIANRRRSFGEITATVDVEHDMRRVCEVEGTRSRIGEVQINGCKSIVVQTFVARYPNGDSERRVLLDGEDLIDMTKTQARTLIAILTQAVEN